MMFRHLFVFSTNNANGRSALKWERFDAIAASDYLNTVFGIVARYSSIFPNERYFNSRTTTDTGGSFTFKTPFSNFASLNACG